MWVRTPAASPCADCHCGTCAGSGVRLAGVFTAIDVDSRHIWPTDYVVWAKHELRVHAGELACSWESPRPESAGVWSCRQHTTGAGKGPRPHGYRPDEMDASLASEVATRQPPLPSRGREGRAAAWVCCEPPARLPGLRPPAPEPAARVTQVDSPCRRNLSWSGSLVWVTQKPRQAAHLTKGQRC